MTHNPTQLTHGASADRPDNAVWHRSSYSGTQGNCVEIAHSPAGFVAVRDSKNPNDRKLLISGTAWRAFLHSLKHPEPQ